MWSLNYRVSKMSTISHTSRSFQSCTYILADLPALRVMREKLLGMASQMNGKGSILFGFLNSRQIRLHLNCLDKIPGQLPRREFSCRSSIFQTIVPGLYMSKRLHFTQCRSSKGANCTRICFSKSFIMSRCNGFCAWQIIFIMISGWYMLLCTLINKEFLKLCSVWDYFLSGLSTRCRHALNANCKKRTKLFFSIEIF